MIRLDKFLCSMEIGSRSQVKELIRKGLVQVNGRVIRQPDTKVDEKKDRVICQNNPVFFQSFVYYMLNKPGGVVSAVKDPKEKTVLDLLKKATGKDLFPVGRLDKDTEGLLLITNDGPLGHRLLSPSRHVPKTYLVETLLPLSFEMIAAFETGIDIGDDKPTRPAKILLLKENRMELTITEGRYHQIKRMLKAVGNEVTYLKRLSMGSLQLDKGLAPGEYRSLTNIEIEQLRQG